MLQLVKRCPGYVAGYKAYCQEAFDNNVIYFMPTNPLDIDDNWFLRTKAWYDKKESGLIEGQSASFHYWAVDDDKFVGEFQLRTEFTEQVMTGIGSIGYAVRVSEWGKGYGTEILRQGLQIAMEHNMEKVLLNINENNAASIRVCEKLGGKLLDKIEAYNKDEGHHLMRRYWIYL
ncbi:MAG: GNAT family N-acetyltransferase [Lachnospiraceae bacterium]|nr:GNAT family N-acetyltransferase [Lachnospiraceae bacterium]MDE7240049.1 GNAT family N-acetyltransferase [Lachnospiraceae bacterium]